MAEHGPIYSLARLTVAFNVLPEGLAALPEAPPGLGDGQVDPVFEWLQDHDRVLGSASRGWVPIACPWEDQHTPGPGAAKGTDYHPGAPGGFNCFHGHCIDAKRDTKALKAWIVEQDPDASLEQLEVLAGLDLQGIGASIAAALAESERRSAENPDRRSDGESVRFVPVEERAAATVRADVIKDLVHVANQTKYWSIRANDLIDYRALDHDLYSRLRAQGLLAGLTPAGKPTILQPSAWLKGQPDTQRVGALTHRLGQPLIVEGCLNIAPPLPPRLETEGDPAPWHDLVSFICGSEHHAGEVLDWMALVVTAWDEKPGWHLLIKGPPGIGKDLMLSPLVWYLAPKHWYGLTVKDIEGDFTPFLTRRLVMIDELKMTTRGTMNPHDVYNAIKAWTARGTRWVMINEKNRRPYEALDLSCWAPTSNAEVPLPLEDGDRRWDVVETPRALRPKSYYLAILRWLEKEDGHAIVISALQRRWDAMSEEQRDLVRGTAPVTEAKRELILNSAEGIDGAVKLAIAGVYGDKWPDLMRVEDVVQNLKNSDLLSDQARRGMTTKRVAMALKAAGAVHLFKGGRVEDRAVRRTLHLWCLRSEKVKDYEKLGQGKLMIETYDAQRLGRVPAGDNVHTFKSVPPR